MTPEKPTILRVHEEKDRDVITAAATADAIPVRNWIRATAIREARKAYQASTEKAKGFGGGLVNIGRMELEAGRRGEAYAAFQQAVQVDPLQPAAHLNFALAKKQQKDYAEAVKHVARYKLPKAFVYRETLVRSPAGKADYRWAKATAATDAG